MGDSVIASLSNRDRRLSFSFFCSCLQKTNPLTMMTLMMLMMMMTVPFFDDAILLSPPPPMIYDSTLSRQMIKVRKMIVLNREKGIDGECEMNERSLPCEERMKQHEGERK